jgi:AraC-like DNA-binding protein
MAPRDYASRVRERRARMLLLDEDLSIERVAQQLGFDEPAHFSRQFKRWSGMSPRDFRTRHVRA